MNNKISSAMAAVTLIMAFALAATAALADEQHFSLSSRFDTSSNQYASGPWLFKLSVPTGTGNVVPEIGGLRASTISGTSPSGLADTEAAATYNLYPGSASSPEIDLTGKIKVNIADENTVFGLNRNDYAAQMDVYQSLDRFTAKGSLGSRVLGNPTGNTLNPLLYGSFGGSYKLTDQTSTGVDMSLTQNPSSAVQQELSAYVSYKLDENLKARGYVLRGYSNGNPNNVVGGQVYYGF